METMKIYRYGRYPYIDPEHEAREKARYEELCRTGIIQKMKVRTQVITLKNGKKKTIKHTRVV